MERARVSVETGVWAGPAVEKEFFGGNFLFDRDRTGEAGTFDEKADALDLGLLRYPGGTITERYFDLTDPDQIEKPGAHGDDVTPLSDFLAYAGDAGAPVSLVLPTIRYMDALRTGEMTEAEVRAELAAFLSELLDGRYGDAAAVEIFEIGNEYYDGAVNPDGDAMDYGAIARIFAEEIRTVFGDAADIAAQAGRNAADNAAILDALGAADALIDRVVRHDHPWTLAQARQHFETKTALAQDWLDGVAEGVFLSEWSLSNQREYADGRLIGDAIADGMGRAMATVDIAGRFIAAGVDRAAVWPIQQNTRGDLGGDEGETAASDASKLSGAGLTTVGEAFRLMSEILPGMRPIAAPEGVDLDGRREAVREDVLIQAYEDGGKVVLFLSAVDISGAAELRLDLGGAYSGYEMVRLSATGDAMDPNADPVLAASSGGAFSGGLAVGFDGAPEIVRLTLTKAASRLKGSAGDDTLKGGAGEETVVARGGDDLVLARGGDDKLKGGGGADRLSGQRGDDDLRGGAGQDALKGGGGRDLLKGGGGADVLKGGGGADTLDGGAGADIAWGGGGADTFVFGGRGAMTVKDFRPGQDLLEFRAASDFSDLTISEGPRGLLIASGAAEALLEGVSAEDLSADDFLF